MAELHNGNTTITLGPTTSGSTDTSDWYWSYPRDLWGHTPVSPTTGLRVVLDSGREIHMTIKEAKEVLDCLKDLDD